jgi:hypothetical protein
MPFAALSAHPRSGVDAVHGIEARIERAANGVLEISYTLRGDVRRLRVPPFVGRRMGERLWEHTCFEAFVRAKHARRYHEFNFAPSGEWTVLAFDDYREGGALRDEALAPEIAVHATRNTLQLDAAIPLARACAGYGSGPLAIGLSAVIEGTDGALSYWALAHGAGKPDFHAPVSFALELE